VTKNVAPGTPAKTRRKRGPTSVAIPRKARAMGFTGSVGPTKRLPGKILRLRSGSPVTHAHEFGARPQGHPWLYIPIRSQAEAKRLGISDFSRRRAKRGKNKGQPLQKPRMIRVRSVTIRPRLGFRRLWRAYERTISKRLHTTLTRIADRAEAAALKKGPSIRETVLATLEAERLALDV